MKRRSLALALSLSLSGCSGADPQDFDLGMDALRAGDYAEAYHRWLPLAERGHAESQYHIGWLYANGNGLRVDMGRAAEWWERAATQGHADAQFALGFALAMGDGMARDPARAVDWYLAAARRGHRDARDILVQMAADPDAGLVANHPEVLDADWFGWQGTIKGERANVRADSGTNHKIVAKLEQGTSVRVIGRRGEWLQIRFATAGGKAASGWIFENLLQETGD